MIIELDINRSGALLIDVVSKSLVSGSADMVLRRVSRGIMHRVECIPDTASRRAEVAKLRDLCLALDAMADAYQEWEESTA